MSSGQAVNEAASEYAKTSADNINLPNRVRIMMTFKKTGRLQARMRMICFLARYHLMTLFWNRLTLFPTYQYYQRSRSMRLICWGLSSFSCLLAGSLRPDVSIRSCIFNSGPEDIENFKSSKDKQSKTAVS